LLRISSPFAVVRAVVFIIIHAFNGQSRRRPDAHVSEKVLEFMPSVANRDTSTSIVTEASMRRAVTTLKHTIPNMVFRGLSHCLLI
jgi:hypothetical protein